MSDAILIVMRHAKSSWESPGMSDFERPLNERGERDATRMGRWLGAAAWQPARILSSPALRPRQTVERVAAGLAEPPAPDFERALYLADLETLLDQAEAAAEGPLLLVGHNPGLEYLVRHLVTDVERIVETPKVMPTAAVYVLAVQFSGHRLKAGGAKLLAHQRPKNLAE